MGEYLPLDYVCDDGDLTIDGFPLRCPAWAVYDLTGLWLPAALRGRNRIVPGAAGTIINPKRVTITRHSLVLGVTGGYDQTGAVNPDPWVGLEENLDAIIAAVFDPPVLPDVSRTATLTKPSGTVLTAEVQCFDLQEARGVEAVRVYTFEMELPMGEFA